LRRWRGGCSVPHASQARYCSTCITPGLFSFLFFFSDFFIPAAYVLSL
jgi:hypothetical protein